MANSRISVGDDTASGEPANGPKGPYITDDSDDEMRDAQRKSDKSKDPKVANQNQRQNMKQ